MKITVCIPTYQRSELLDRLINTIPKDIKIYVSDNGKTTSKFVREKNSQVKFSSIDEVLPMFDNWNRAISISDDSDYIIVPSDDDIFYPGAFNKIEKNTTSNPEVDIFVFGNNFIDENQLVTGTYQHNGVQLYDAPDGFINFIFGVSARMPSIVFKRKFLNRIGFFDPAFKITAADSELIQRALLLGKSKFIPDTISGYTIWSGSATNRTLATINWMKEIDFWTTKITQLVETRFPMHSLNGRMGTYRDEIYAQNLLSGLQLLYIQKKYHEAVYHFKSCRFPKNAKVKTLLRLFKVLIGVKFKLKF